MRSTALIPTALALAAPAAAGMYDDWHFGNMFTLGPTSDDVAITKATYSLVPPPVPCGVKQTRSTEAPWLSIWVGVSGSMSSQAEDLFQPLLNWSPDQEAQGCPATDKEWCVATSTYHLSGQVQEPYVTVPNDSEIEFTISVENNKIKQEVVIDGKTVSEQSDDKSISPKWIYSSNECYLNTCGLVDGYTWSDMTIHLSGADPNFGETLTLTGASSDGLTTSDGGKTWTAKAIKIKQDKFDESGAGEGCSASS
ncbi:hypothetical protein P170DRAFT_440057 [Aspergillus steynii IBT 23096]|uniref:Concanavalin A-like lectin/glucanase n=1 Tax=Aspergillus steynii IBT 23096 TaxID=1392250 RepID=A0A2I2FW20_9EURO|nr:uncharacterized protein P170DRAFT_440057 [Aspergillus steynii IBT 23096]PLB44843.1 hypothetical protein P170DRAFT_440057 [Aspergillus steynii IBT 23096]